MDLRILKKYIVFKNELKLVNSKIYIVTIGDIVTERFIKMSVTMRPQLQSLCVRKTKFVIIEN